MPRCPDTPPPCRLHTASPIPHRSGTLSILAGCRHTGNKILRPHAAALPPAHRKSDAALFGRSQHPRRMPSHGQQNLAPARRRPAACTLQIRCRAVRALSASSQDAVTRTTKSCARTPPCRLHTANPMPCRSGTLSILAGCRHTDNKILRPHAALPLHTPSLSASRRQIRRPTVRYRRTCAQTLRVVDRHREMFAEKFLAFS